jgi:tyrosyl-tRNA synthetase
VALKCDIEMGGTDQKFNLLLGRQIQQEYGQEGQIIFLNPLLPGTDGTQKMSKSLGNYIGISEPPAEIYGKTMSIPDNLILPYFRFTTDLPTDELQSIKNALDNPQTNPRDYKRRLAKELVRMYHSPESATDAEKDFDLKFVQKGIPDDIEVKSLPEGSYMVCKILNEVGLTGSVAEAKRMIENGSVKIDGMKILDCYGYVNIDNVPKVFQVGKRKFKKVISGFPISRV